MKIVNYLEITFNLNEGTFKSYTKSKMKLNTYTKTHPSTKCHLPNPTIHRNKVIHSIL